MNVHKIHKKKKKKKLRNQSVINEYIYFHVEIELFQLCIYTYIVIFIITIINCQ